MSRRLRRGAAAVEFVLTLPVLWLVLMVLLEMATLWTAQSRVGRVGHGLARALSAVSDMDDGEALALTLVREHGLREEDIVSLAVDRTATDLTVELEVAYDPLVGLWPQGDGPGQVPASLRSRVVYPRQDDAAP